MNERLVEWLSELLFWLRRRKEKLPLNYRKCPQVLVGLLWVGLVLRITCQCHRTLGLDRLNKSSTQKCFSFFFFFKVTYLFLAVLGLFCCAWVFSSCGEQGLLSGCSPQAPGARASGVVAHRLSCPASCGIPPDQDWTRVPWIAKWSQPLDHHGSPILFYENTTEWRSPINQYELGKLSAGN